MRGPAGKLIAVLPAGGKIDGTKLLHGAVLLLLSLANMLLFLLCASARVSCVAGNVRAKPAGKYLFWDFFPAKSVAI